MAENLGLAGSSHTLLSPIPSSSLFPFPSSPFSLPSSLFPLPSFPSSLFPLFPLSPLPQTKRLHREVSINAGDDYVTVGGTEGTIHDEQIAVADARADH